MPDHYYCFKITFLQQLLLLIPFIATAIVVTIIYYYLFGFKTLDVILIAVIFFYFLVEVLPVLLVHIQYLYKNWGNILILDVDNKSILLEHRDSKKQYSFNDIKVIKYYATGGHISTNGSSLYYSFDPYRFYKIIFKDKSEMIITCLMINNIENTLENL